MAAFRKATELKLLFIGCVMYRVSFGVGTADLSHIMYTVFACLLLSTGVLCGLL